METWLVLSATLTYLKPANMPEKLTVTEEKAIRDEFNELVADKTLSFGCEVLVDDGKGGVVGRVVHKDKCLDNGKDFANLVFPYEWEARRVYFDCFEIIGHPITLERVLMKLSDRYTVYEGATYRDGIFRLMPKAAEENYIIYWELNKPADEQSIETIQALLKILKPTNNQ